MPAPIDYTGRRYGRLTVLRNGEKRNRRLFTVHCRCDCGAEFEGQIHCLRTGMTRSCGCLRRETAAHNAKTGKRLGHHLSRTPEHHAWLAMRARCENPNLPAFAYYGGRGIRVCDRWNNSFEAFLADMGKRPSPTHSLDRIDTNGNYEPSNCRWATKTEQARNTRKCVRFEVNGKRLSLSELSTLWGLSQAKAKHRAMVLGLQPVRLYESGTCSPS